MVEPTVDKIIEGQLRWLSHVTLMTEDRIAKRVVETKEHATNKRRRSRRMWFECLKENIRRIEGSEKELKKVVRWAGVPR